MFEIKSRVVTINIFLLILIAGLVSNCAVSVMELHAKHTAFPISMTAVIQDSAGKLVRSNDYDSVCDFLISYSHFSLSPMWPKRKIDFSDTLSKLVALFHGDAVVNLSVSGGSNNKYNGINFFGSLFGCLSLGVFAFTKVESDVRGTIIRFKEIQQPPARKDTVETLNSY